MAKNKLCGNCEYNEWNARDEEFYCANENSDCYGCPTFYDDGCEDWEAK